jgi:hypothetical protein
LFHNYNLHYQKFNNVSMYFDETIKIFISLSLLLLLFRFIFAIFCLPYKITALVSLHIWTLLFTLSLLNLGNVLVVTFIIVSQNATILSGKKPKFECIKWIFKDITPHGTVWWNWLPHFLTVIFNFSLPRKFVEDSSKFFQALSFEGFNFVLDSWSSNGCVICVST